MYREEIARECLQKNTVLYLEKIDSDKQTRRIDRFVINQQKGEPGSSAICYEAELVYESTGRRIPGTLKEFYPRQYKLSDEEIESETHNGSRTFKQLVNLVRTNNPDERFDSQLVVGGDFTRENFFALRREYKQAYEHIHQAKSTNRLLTRPIGHFDLYKSNTNSDDPENYTIYVWTPFDDEIITFEDFLKKVCEETDNNEFKSDNLRIILESIKNLAISINDLHRANVLHLDISPKNFGLKLLNNKPDGQVSLFDVNTVYPIDGSSKNSCAGTPGFRSLRLLHRQANIKCDLFSIGACLYYALVMRKSDEGLENVCFISPTDDTLQKHDVYKVNEALNHIEADLVSSPLFSDCDFNEDSDIVKSLAEILKRCLAFSAADADKQYETGSSIVEDLQEVIDRWNIHIGVENSANEKNVITIGSVSKELEAEKRIKLGANGAIQWLLYQKPLYEYAYYEIENRSKKLNIMVLGGGNYASKFIDIAFQMMQIEGYVTEITIASKDVYADKNNFLAKRPAFCDFFEIRTFGKEDDSKTAKIQKAKKCGQEPYGTVNFVLLSEAFDKQSKYHNEVIVRDVISRTEISYSYVFVAMHNDELNLAAAEATACVLTDNDRMVPVNFVVFGDLVSGKNVPFITPSKLDELSQKYNRRLQPVYINQTIDMDPDYDFLRKLAFNVHLTWCGALEDIANSGKEFLKPYNYTSSFSNALSIKYKLKSIGIDFDISDIYSVIEKFYRITGLEQNGIGNDCCKNLILFEHRRWIVESIAKGYRCLEKEEFDVLVTATQDKKGKRHPCLVTSTSEYYLDSTWSKNLHAKWKHADVEVELHDELDKMSVYLYRHFSEYVKKHKNEIVANVREILGKISSIISQKLIGDFASYEQTVWATVFENHDGNEITSYKYYRRIFERAVKSVYMTDADKKIADNIIKSVEQLDKHLFPVIQSNDFTVYKLKDKDLIENIPFILTYNRNLHLMIPMITSQNVSEAFENIAVALMLNPSQISYIIDDNSIYDKDGNLSDTFISSLCFVSRLMRVHNLQTRIRFLILRNKKKGNLNIREIDEIRSKSNRISYIKTLLYDTHGLQKCLNEYLIKQENSFLPIDAILKNETRISGYLDGCLRANGRCFPSFSFDAKDQIFSDLDDEIKWFSFIPFRPSLRVDDLFISQDKEINFSEPVLFSEYNTLWNLYKPLSVLGNPKQEKEASADWKRLTSLLKTNVDEKLMSVGTTNTMETGEVESLKAFLPAMCNDSLNYIFDILKAAEVIRPLLNKHIPEIVSITPYMLKIEIDATTSAAKALRKLFSTPEKLFDKKRIDISSSKNAVVFTYDNLSVDSFSLNPDSDAAILDYLDKLSSNGYILGYHRPMNKEEQISFCFCSSAIKHVLTNEGSIFELYAYYRAISSAAFDDVKTNCVVSWNDKSTNEFDIVATKGFRTYLFECKMREELTQDMYHKLFSLSTKFGINSQSFLLADLNAKLSSANEKQIAKGKEYGITTIWRPEALSTVKDEDGRMSGGIKKTFRQLVK